MCRSSAPARLLVLSMLLGGSLLAVPHAVAQPGPPLWTPASGGERAGGSLSADIRVVRSRAITLEAARAVGPDVVAGTRVQLPLFDDLALEGTVTARTERGPGSRSVKGRVEGPVGGRFFLVGEGDAVVGNVTLDDGRAFRIRPAADGSGARVREIDARRAAPCRTTGDEVSPAPRDRPAPDLRRGVEKVDDGSLIDVHVLYTAAARDSLGSTQAMNAWIQLAIDVTNDAYELSQVVHRLRLVGRSATPWVENGANTSQALTGLASDGDAVMDEAHDLRDQNGADIVSLVFVASDPCGRGFVGGTTDAGDGFNVNHWNCIDAAGGWTLAHEIGHNLGSGHDVASPDSPLFAYSIGHQINGDTGTWTTIMARRAVVGARIGYFSNPNVDFDGAATGVPTNQTGAAHNQLTFANVDATAAQWRTSLPAAVWVDFDYLGTEFGIPGFPFNTLAEAIDAVVYGGDVFVIGGGATSEAITIGPFKPCTIRWGAP